MKGREQAADEQPVLSAERHFNETWLKRAMERMEHRLQATICSSLETITYSVGDLEAHVITIKEHISPPIYDEQAGNGAPESGQWRDPLAKTYPAKKWVES